METSSRALESIDPGPVCQIRVTCVTLPATTGASSYTRRGAAGERARPALSLRAQGRPSGGALSLTGSPASKGATTIEMHIIWRIVIWLNVLAVAVAHTIAISCCLAQFASATTMVACQVIATREPPENLHSDWTKIGDQDEAVNGLSKSGYWTDTSSIS